MVIKSMNVVHLLEQRQRGSDRGARNMSRLNMRILRNLLASTSKTMRSFPDRLQIHADVRFDDGKMFFVNSANKTLDCYCVNGHQNRIRKLWSIPSSPRVEDQALVPSGPLASHGAPLPLDGHKASLLVLRTGSLLERYLLHNGVRKEQIRLSSSCKFLHISEDPERSWIMLKSVRHPFKSQLSNHHVCNDDAADVVVRFIIMQQRPLCFLDQFEVRRSVFGKKVQDADLSNGMLVVMLLGGEILLYSVDSLLSQRLPDQQLQHQQQGTKQQLGSCSHFPLTCKASEAPPVLLRVNSHQHSLQICVNTWQYIRAFSETSYSIHRISDHTLVGRLSCPAHQEPDSVIFLPDDSGYVAQFGESGLQIFNPSSMDTVFSFACHEKLSQTEVTEDVVTRSGRKVRGPAPSHQHAHKVVSFDYEDELDVLVLLVHGELECEDQEEFAGGVAVHLQEVRLYENVTFRLLRIVCLDEILCPAFDPSRSISVALDLDILFIKVRGKSRTDVLLYQLAGDPHPHTSSPHIQL